jgi:hypothetical protein
MNTGTEIDLTRHIERRRPTGHVALPIRCRDGWSASVQASQHHYCSPRRDSGPWDSVEVGYPSSEEDALLPYADEPGDPLSSVYGYVPLAVVARVVEARGGLVDPADDSGDDWASGDLAWTPPAAGRIPFLTDASAAPADPLVLMHGGASWRGPTLPPGRPVLVTGRRGPLVAVLCGDSVGHVHHSWLTRTSP